MMKILGLYLMVGVFGMSAFASDNISIPNTFSSGSTISSSQMNENFELISDEYIGDKDEISNKSELITSPSIQKIT